MKVLRSWEKEIGSQKAGGEEGLSRPDPNRRCPAGAYAWQVRDHANAVPLDPRTLRRSGRGEEFPGDPLEIL